MRAKFRPTTIELRRSTWPAVLAATLLLAGCRHVALRGVHDLPQTPATYSLAGGDTPPPSRWWMVFSQPALSRCVERALAGNMDLLAAWERLRAARALALREGADRWPQLNGVAGAGYERDSDAGTTRRYNAGLEARYEVDLWGTIQSRAQAESARAEASLAAYQTVALTLSAEVALAWVQLGAARAQLALVNEQIETNRNVLELLQARFDAGMIRRADILRQRQLLESTREQGIAVRERIALRQHRLAVLEGRPPRQTPEAEDAVLPTLPPLPATGLPAELVERRPDVRAAFLALQAADHDLAGAISDRYPRITITASLETAAARPDQLFSDWLTALAGELVAPLVTGGRLSAEVTRREAQRAERLAQYRQAMLTALREVEDALVSERQQHQRVDSLQTQLALATQTYNQLRVQYANGVTDYIAVLAALGDRQRLQRDLVAARLAMTETRIGLYRALAGSIETDRERELNQTSQGDPDHG